KRTAIPQRRTEPAPALTPQPDLAPAATPTPQPAPPTPAPQPTKAEPAPAPAEAPAPSTAGDPIREKVLSLVAEQTGYPPDMLDVDLDLEADLGIDTVKQAEMFAAVREAYDIERDEDMQLRDFPTLAHVIGFVHDKRPDVKQASAAASSEAPTSAPEAPTAAPTADPVQDKVLDLIAEQTGYPKDMLDLDLDLEADLGIDTVKQAELFAAVREEYGIERDDNLQLSEFPTLAHTIEFVYEKRPDLRPDAARTTPATASDASTDGASAAPADDEAVKEKVLDIVAEQTGYPKDMLDLDLDLEADLGIDTVKQAEMFANIRAEYDIPRDDDLQLSEFPTLVDVIQFVYDRAPSLGDGASAPAEAAPSDGVEAPAVATQEFEATLEAAATIPRRVPVPVLRPDLDRCTPTGVTLDDDSRVVVMLDEGGVGAKLVGRLEDRGVAVLAIDDAPDAETLTERLEAFVADGPVTGVYWLPALDEATPLFEMEGLDEWREALRRRVKLLYATMRTLYDQVSGPETFLVAATRLGGLHGYDEAGAVAPLGGAVVGFAKAFKRERSDALVKAVDFASSRKTASLADLLIDETLRDPGVVEVGYGPDDAERYAISLEVQDLPESDDGMELTSDTVFVVTGGAGSIVSAITRDLAEASGGTFYLLDLVPAPDPDDPDVARFVSDKDGLKRDLFERIKASGERATPAMVENELAMLERAHAALSAIQAVEQAGGTAHYHSVNLLDADGLRAVIDDVREEHGRIDVLLHAGGLEISRFLPDKEPKEFDLVFDVKCDGWFNLLHAIGDMPLGATVVFSSVAGRFGNAGQTDYSAANDLLCKTSSSFRTARPATRGLAIDWTAWGGIGMATRGSIPKMMEAAGIDMLPPEAGIPIIRRELTKSDWSGEFVAGKALGILVEEWDATGGADPDAFATDESGPMTGTVTGFTLYDGLTIETTLDPAEQPFLDDHRIDGTPVLPGVMGIEAFAELAQRAFPDRHAAAVEDVDFLAPFKFYRDAPRTVTLHATFQRDGDDLLAACHLTGTRELPMGTETTTHFTGTVRLTTEAPTVDAMTAPAAPEGEVVDQDAIYQIYFHDDAYQVLERAWMDDGTVVGRMADDLPANHTPEDRPLVMAPRLIELCFQTAGVSQIGTDGSLGLPQHVGRVQALRAPEMAKGQHLYAVVTPRADGAYDARVVDEDGAVYVVLIGYQTIAMPGGVDDDALAPLAAAMAH
ncbi:MAG: SDR family NAD(P)-dependent oxidoreductase, partial [Bacteroidetes bacterium]|nr:SDR family NAD(P)-dependent oxidoreductase [Bacteroidota bacterium]